MDNTEPGVTLRITWTGAVVCTWLAAAVVTTVLARVLAYPLTDEETRGREPWEVTAFFVSLVALGALAFIVHTYAPRSRWLATLGIVMLALAGPVVAVALGVAKAEDHRAQDEMFAVYDRYVSAIPREFGKPWIYVRAEDFGTVCGLEVRRADNDWLCLTIHLSEPSRHEVLGGYRATIEDSEVTTGPGLAFQCWGFERTEGTCDYLREK